MANSCSVHLNRSPSPEEITSISEQVLQEHFGPWAHLLSDIDKETGEGTWTIEFPLEPETYDKELLQPSYRFCFWLVADDRLELRHGAPDFLWWAHLVVFEDLAERLGGGDITDGGAEGSWLPSFHKEYPTYSAWVHSRGGSNLYNFLGKVLKDSPLPQELIAKVWTEV